MKNLFALNSRIINFRCVPWSVKLLLLEAFVLTGAARLAVIVLPFKKLAAVMGKHTEESPVYADETARDICNKVGWAVGLMSSHTPWQSKCFVQALAAQCMLKRRGISSTLYLGVARDGENRLIAHAWLRSGPDILTGGPERKQFTEVAHFAGGTGGERR